MIEEPIYSLEIERHALGGLIKHPGVLAQVDNFVTGACFFNSTHETIFSVVKDLILHNEKLDKVLVAQKIKNLGISFKDDINIFDYIDGLAFTQITEEAAVESFKELIKIKVRRELIDTANEIKKFVYTNGQKTLDELVSGTDSIYTRQITNYSKGKQFENIFETIEQAIEEIGNNPPIDNFLGPFDTINRLYGSLLRPGGVTLVGARTGVGKTQLGMYYLIWCAAKYNLPILHLDFSEMSKEDLQIRAAVMVTGGRVPYYAVENGDWRKNPEWTKYIREGLSKLKRLRMHYEDIGSMTSKEVISLIRKFSYSIAGRGNRFFIHYDYFKPFSYDPKLPEWKEMGHFMQELKSLITNEIPASVWASIQLNRTGITNNKHSADVDDSENAFALSDRIIQQTTHSFIYRYKLVDELMAEEQKYGNALFKPVKHRFLGKEADRALAYLKSPSSQLKKNYINLNSRNFCFKDHGDLHGMMQTLNLKTSIANNQPDNVHI